MWLGLVYAMMVISLQSFQVSGDEPLECRGQLDEMVHKYRRLTELAINIGALSTPRHCAVETLLLYIIGQLARSKDNDINLLYKVSHMVRVAMVMGYHSDSVSTAAFTPFIDEMRRRVWCSIMQIDLAFASRMGLQPIIRPESTDMKLPKNIYDDELREDLKELPPSRPLTEPTPACYAIYRSKLLSVFAEIWQGTQPKVEHTRSTVMELDNRLNQTISEIPPLFKMRPLEESMRDSPEVVVQRYSVDLLFLSARCILHRRFIHSPKDNFKHGSSKQIAIESALRILDHQATLNRECSPGGRLHKIKWFDNFLTMHDFQLGAMIVCLELYNVVRAERLQNSESTFDTTAQEKMLRLRAALEQSQRIWQSLSEMSKEASKASAMISAILSISGQQNSTNEPEARNPYNPTEETTMQKLAVPDMNFGVLMPSSVAELQILSDTAPFNPTHDHQSPGSSGAISTPHSSTGMTPQYLHQFLHPSLESGSESRTTSNMFGLFGALPDAEIMPDAGIDWVSSPSHVREIKNRDVVI